MTALPPCRRAEGIEPPECCQPPLEERISRLERAREAVDAVTPRICPACGSRRIAPLFWVDADVFDCADCCAIFTGRD